MVAAKRFGQAVRWVAGVGLVSNWIARKRNVGTEDAHIQVPSPKVDLDLKTHINSLRGETVSVGGMVEWIIATLANRFVQTSKENLRGQWDTLKRYIKAKGLTSNLAGEIDSVGRYFKPRNLAAHAGTIITGVGESTQIFRVYRQKGKPRVELVTLDKLGEEAAAARAGYNAIRAIGRALDDDDSTVLADMSDFTKAMLLGRT